MKYLDEMIEEAGAEIENLKKKKGYASNGGYQSYDQTILGSLNEYVSLHNTNVEIDTNGGDILVMSSFYAKTNSASYTGNACIFIDDLNKGRAFTIVGGDTHNYTSSYIIKNVPAGHHIVNLRAKPDASNTNIVLPRYFNRNITAIEL